MRSTACPRGISVILATHPAADRPSTHRRPPLVGVGPDERTGESAGRPTAGFIGAALQRSPTEEGIEPAQPRACEHAAAVFGLCSHRGLTTKRSSMRGQDDPVAKMTPPARPGSSSAPSRPGRGPGFRSGNLEKSVDTGGGRYSHRGRWTCVQHEPLAALKRGSSCSS
jgi:hypothetical protein